MVYRKTSAGYELESVPFSTGRIEKTTSGYDISYHLTDQVGSVRAVINGVGEVQQQSDYYAFGLRHASTDFATNDNRYQLTGKESQKDFGFNYLNGSGGDLYVSLSSLDLSWLRSLGKKYVGEEYPFNLFFLSPDIHTRLVYGNIRFKRYPNHQVRGFNDIYDFEFHPFSLGITPRNIVNAIGRLFHSSDGVRYKIQIHGNATLKPAHSVTE